MRKVRSHVKLVVESVKSEEMKKILRQTAIGEWKGETCQSASEWLSQNNVLEVVLCYVSLGPAFKVRLLVTKSVVIWFVSILVMSSPA